MQIWTIQYKYHWCAMYLIIWYNKGNILTYFDIFISNEITDNKKYQQTTYHKKKSYILNPRKADFFFREQKLQILGFE